MATIDDTLYLHMKQADALLPKVVGTVSALSDQVERAKRAMEQKFGMPSSADIEYLMIWTDLDHAVCTLRQLDREYLDMVKGQQS